MKKYIIFNPLADNTRGEKNARLLDNLFPGHTLVYRDITEISSYSAFFSTLSPDDEIILCGGDGTLSRFVNNIDGVEIKNKIFYYATGNGNDFFKDLEKIPGSEPFCINEYIEKLPTIIINNKKRKFVNGIGYGLDGYVCEVVNKLRKTKRKVNYTAVALKSLLFEFKPRSADITIDGKTRHYDKVWLTPTMFGRFFGGGMMIAPNRRRDADNLDVVIVHSIPRLLILYIFPTIFKGKHIKYKKYVEVLSGNDITISYDVPCSLQVDGETILGVKSYSAKSIGAAEKELTVV